ncbi:phenol-soluble modulin export ABC transporter permease subunit PmtB [Staphylococcus haemolyticus]|uniref:phenol-soluble modulin export ABC transporter permease subunit PmtB n=1 Tax=Staphylococcus haemolyticus TaxID=1283 RepID=UPI0020BDBA43|nr:ABC-2 transporter permease [Staphylococcus haemolyticus]
MKQLLIRNFKCRSITIAIYILLLLLNPLYAFVFSKTELYFLFYAPIAITLMAVSILDSGHLFRLHRRLGGKSSYLFYESLPVSKKDMLNANYITCIVLTLFGGVIIALYNFQSSNIDFGDLRYSTAIAFIFVNFLSIPIAFSRNTEKKRERISYAPYILIMMLVFPFAITMVFTLINAFVFHHHISYNIFGIYYNYGLLSLSIVWMIINYLIQLRRIIHRENKGGPI